ncbi:MAG: DEAD/DEAH box helicase [Syntrophomonadaceae bacterium]|nr:DEAD/DEAH box helicase [Syntrophomonadaceae bacterium]
MKNVTFKEFELKEALLKSIAKKGYETPTPIQVQAIPIAMSGRDIMGQAQTGTGKTAAFGIPMLNTMEPGGGLQGLVICPTRELAVQVATEIEELGEGLKIHSIPIYGGQDIGIQLRGLEYSPEIVVGTPGRLIDHFWRGSIRPGSLKFVVLDEADEMLDMGFLPDIDKIMSFVPRERVTFLFSATLDGDVQKIARRYMQDPQIVRVEADTLTVELTDQYYCQVNPRKKIETFCRIVDVDRPEVSLVFCRTKRGADQLCRVLNNKGYAAESLHGDMSQRERDQVMHRFRSGKVSILVATDLAARGLDVEQVTHVFNYDLPDDPDSYVHRIGRTGRAGRSGIAISMVEPNQIKQLRTIERHIGMKITPRVLPSHGDAVVRRNDNLMDRVEKALGEGSRTYEAMAAELLTRHEAPAVLAAALMLLASDEPELETADLSAEQAGIVHVELQVGRNQGLHPRRLADYLVQHTSLSEKEVGDIDIHAESTFVEVPMLYVDEVYRAFENFSHSDVGTPRNGGGRRRSHGNRRQKTPAPKE